MANTIKNIQQQIGKAVIAGIFVGAVTIAGFTINIYYDIRSMQKELQNVTELSNSNAKDVVDLDKNLEIHKAVTEPRVLGN